jgi:hypothetical protein
MKAVGFKRLMNEELERKWKERTISLKGCGASGANADGP